MARTWWAKGVAMIGLLALLAAACGGDGDSTDGTVEDGADSAGTDSGADEAPTASSAGSDAGDDDAEQAAGLDAVCEAGAEEGGFTYWATFEPDNFERITAPFSEAYPGIDIDFLPLRPQEAVQRIITEAGAGQDLTVDMLNGNLDALLPLQERELADTEVDWAALGVPDDLIHETGTVRLYLVPQGLAYNTETHSADDLPDTWEELVDEQWRGDVVVDPRGTPFNALSLELGAEATVDYVQRLADVVQPIVIEGGTAGMQAVAGGEAAISTGGRGDSAAELQEQGVPIDVKYLDIVPTTDFYNMVLRDSEQRNAALCFAGWLATPEGRAVHEEVEFKANETMPPGVPDDAVIVSIDTAEEAELAAEVAEQITAIWTQGG